MGYYFYTEKMSVGYQMRPLIEKIQIGLEKGEILTLIGPNGAGKSTVLKSIARQIKMVAGAAYIGGGSIGRMSGAELSRKMAVVFTERLRAELMSCGDVVATGRYPYTGKFGILSKKDARAVEEAMELVQVGGIRDLDFAKASDGQRQRVMLARAICQEPEVLVLDEPTSYLDVRYKLEFLSALQRMREKKGLTVIMSLHELDLAARVSDKILCLNGKYAEKFGPPEEVFADGYVGKLFGISKGSFEDGSGGVELEAPRGEAQVFVIAGGGSGRNAYRRLQREGTAFASGILFENDLDYPVAKALAAECIAARAFEPVPEETVRRAMRAVDGCRKVVCCRESFGTYEAANERLLLYAKSQGKEIARA